MKVLITGGATQEPIDQVRVITNMSTGRTAATIADAFIQEGAEVTYAHGVQAILPKLDCVKREFHNHASLESLLTNLLSHEQFNVVIHLAAVSDYTVASIHQEEQSWLPHEITKISSEKNLTVELKPTRKIIHHLKENALFPQFTLVAFKLTVTQSLEERLSAVRKLSQNSAINYIVHNDLHDITSPANHLFTVYRGEKALTRLTNADELSQWLVKLIKSTSMIDGCHVI